MEYWLKKSTQKTFTKILYLLIRPVFGSCRTEKLIYHIKLYVLAKHVLLYNFHNISHIVAIKNIYKYIYIYIYNICK